MEEIAGYSESFKSVVEASDFLYGSDKFRKVVEISLALGNYMNKIRGIAGGFKPTALLDLANTKSKKDKKQRVIHYIIRVIKKHFPECDQFYKDFEQKQPDEEKEQQKLKSSEAGYEINKKVGVEYNLMTRAKNVPLQQFTREVEALKNTLKMT